MIRCFSCQYCPQTENENEVCFICNISDASASLNGNWLNDSFSVCGQYWHVKHRIIYLASNCDISARIMTLKTFITLDFSLYTIIEDFLQETLGGLPPELQLWFLNAFRFTPLGPRLSFSFAPAKPFLSTPTTKPFVTFLPLDRGKHYSKKMSKKLWEYNIALWKHF